MAWQSTHACRFSLPEAVRLTWRQIKHAWCRATAANTPGQERQRERSPTEASFGSRLESGCYRERSKSCVEPAASFFFSACYDSLIICKFSNLDQKVSSSGNITCIYLFIFSLKRACLFINQLIVIIIIIIISHSSSSCISSSVQE